MWPLCSFQPRGVAGTPHPSLGPKQFVQGHTTRRSERGSERARCLGLNLSLPALADRSLGTWGGAVTGHLSLGAFRGCLPPNPLPNIHLEGPICEHSSPVQPHLASGLKQKPQHEGFGSSGLQHPTTPHRLASSSRLLRRGNQGPAS